MRYQVMSVLNACPHHVAADFRNISAGVKRWVRRLKAKGTDKDHSDFMVSKFQGHMEDGLFNVPAADVLDIYDRILQWGSLLDRKRNELRNYFPSPSSGATIPITALNTTTGPSVYKQSTKQDNVPPKQPQHAALPREQQRIRRTLHAHTVARYTSQGVALHHTLTLTTIRQYLGVSLLMARLLHALKGQGPPWISRTGMTPSPDNLFHSTTTRCQRYVKAYRLRKDSITRLEVRPSTFIT